MTRESDGQLELDFENELNNSEQSFVLPSANVSASVFCFSSHIRSRRALEEDAKDAKLVERITSRVKYFK